MNGTSETYPAQAQPRDRSWSLKAVAGGGIGEALGGIAVIVLAIVSLARVIPVELAAIACIVLGASFFCECGTMAGAYRRLFNQFMGRGEMVDVGGGMSVEFLAGMAGIVLGILALFSSAANYLLAPAVVVFGAAMLLSTRTLSRLSWLESSMNRSESAVSHEFVTGSAGGHILVALAAIVLGILALVGLNPIVLIDVAFICLGFALLVVGSAYGASAVRS